MVLEVIMRKGNDGLEWPQTFDAQIWAKEFCDRFSIFTEEGVVLDKEGLMIGWFANAIMMAYDRAHQEHAVKEVVA